MGRSWSALTLAALVACQQPQAAPSSSDAGAAPTYRLRERATTDPGLAPDPDASLDRDEVPIGWFGPHDPSHPLAGGPWTAACLAVEQANARGGWRGRPFRLLPAWSSDPWGSGVRDLTRLVYDEDVRALAGAPDSASAHLVEQVTAKAHLPFVNPVSTDKSAHLAGVPWIFSCAPGDHLLAPLLAAALVEAAGDGSIALVSTTDHDSRLLARELLAALAAAGRGPQRHLELEPGSAALEAAVGELRGVEPQALALVAGPLDSARVLRAVRTAGVDVAVVGGPALGRRACAEAAGAALEGALFPLLWDTDAVGPPAREFARLFEARTGRAPDYAEALAYDSIAVLLDAIGEAGMDRVAIGAALRALSPWSGASGVLSWDRTGQSTRPVPLGTWRDGRAVRVSG